MSEAKLKGFKYEEFTAQLAERSATAFDKIMDDFIVKLRARAPRGSGKKHSADKIELKKSRVGKQAVYQIFAPQTIIWTITGTRPHVIVPRGRQGTKAYRKKVLVWEDMAGTHFAKFVRHPGTKPQPWFAKAVKEAQLMKYLAVSVSYYWKEGMGI